MGANTIITPSVIAKEALMQLENNLVMGNLVHRDYKKEFVKVGSTVSIRKPVKFVASDGAARVNQDVSESTTSIVINKQKHVSWNFSSQELTMAIEKYSERYIKPAMIALSNQVDFDICGLGADMFQVVGTPGTSPGTFASSVALVGQKMDEQAVPADSRKLVLGPAAAWAILGATVGQQSTNLGVFNPKIVEGAFEAAKLGRMGNIELYQDQNIQKHIRGTANTANVVNGSNQTGNSIAIHNGTGTFTVGDIVTFAALYDVNPVSKAALPNLKQFVVTAASAGGTVNLSIYPPIILSGAYQTCTGSITSGDAVTAFTANHVMNLAFAKQCFALVMVPLELPDGAPFKARESYNNLSVRVIKSYDIDADADIIRLDILYGVKTIYPELGVALAG